MIRKDIQQESLNRKEQLQSFKTLHADIQKDVQQQFKQVSEDIAFKALQDRAFRNRKNIVIIGLPEHEVHSAYSVAMRFFKTQLNLRRLQVEEAYRIGQPPSKDSNYIRPLIVKFTNLPDRNSVWKKRNSIPQEEQAQQPVKIQAQR